MIRLVGMNPVGKQHDLTHGSTWDCWIALFQIRVDKNVTNLGIPLKAFPYFFIKRGNGSMVNVQPHSHNQDVCLLLSAPFLGIAFMIMRHQRQTKERS